MWKWKIINKSELKKGTAFALVLLIQSDHQSDEVVSALTQNCRFYSLRARVCARISLPVCLVNMATLHLYIYLLYVLLITFFFGWTATTALFCLDAEFAPRSSTVIRLAMQCCGELNTSWRLEVAVCLFICSTSFYWFIKWFYFVFFFCDEIESFSSNLAFYRIFYDFSYS